MFEEYFSHFVLRTHRYITEVFYFFRFYHCLQYALEKETVSTTSHPKEKVNTSYIRKKKGTQQSTWQTCYWRKWKELENNDHDDPGISVTIFLKVQIWFQNVLVSDVSNRYYKAAVNKSLLSVSDFQKSKI